MNYQDQQEQTTVTPASGDFIDQTLAGKYKIESLLGKGGMSSVYKAQHLLLHKTFAVKIMHAKHIADANAVMRFRQEAAAAISLSHPNIITVYDFDIASERPYQVIDYLEGTSLFEEIQKHKHLPLDRSLHIFSQVCAGLAQAHSKGIIHRDLKPSNVMLVKEGADTDFVKIVDFGIAKVLPQEGEALHRLTQTGEVFGSPYYMSPEQCLGRQLDARADIYSMGCLMYETLVGEPPFVGNAVFETIQKHLDEMPASVKATIKDGHAAERMDYILYKAMAKDPAERYQSMDELRADIDELATGQRQAIGARLGRNAEMLRLKAGQVTRNKPVRLIGVLLTATVILSFFCATPVMRVANAKIPAFDAQPWPQFSPEFEPGSDSTLTALPAFKSALGQINGQLYEMSSDSRLNVGALAIPQRRERALLYRDAAVLESQNGLYQQAAVDASALRVLITGLPDGSRTLDNNEDRDKAKSMADYAGIADACYFANSTTQSTDNALYFYGLASDQMSDAAPRMLRRFYMKMADLLLRQGRAAEAEDMLQKASGQPSQFPRSIIQQAHIDDRAIGDRALYLTKIGEVSNRLNQWTQAAACYEAAAAEWGKLQQPQFEAQCRFLAAACLAKEVERVTDDRALIQAAEHNLKGALAYYGSTNPPDHRKVSAIYAALGKLYARHNNWVQWIDTELRGRSEATKLTIG